MFQPVFIGLATIFWMSVDGIAAFNFDQGDLSLMTSEGNARYLWFNATYLPTVVFMWGLLFTLVAAFVIIYYTGVRNFDNTYEVEGFNEHPHYYSDSSRYEVSVFCPLLRRENRES